MMPTSKTKYGAKICAIIPAYQAEKSVVQVVESLLDSKLHKIVIIDDASRDATHAVLAERFQGNPKVIIIHHPINLGVGGAMKTGYALARDLGLADIYVKIDADLQMDVQQISSLVAPLIDGRADYSKGSRFENPRHIKSMPVTRILGNAALSLITKIATGYWTINDPTNGFTAINAAQLDLLELEKLGDRYFFESDLIFRLRLQRARLIDVPMPSIYGSETSHMRPIRQIPVFFWGNLKNFFKRVIYQYFIREWGPGSFLLPASILSGAFALYFGLSNWAISAASGQASTAGTVSLALLPAILSVQFLLTFLQIDVASEPK